MFFLCASCASAGVNIFSFPILFIKEVPRSLPLMVAVQQLKTKHSKLKTAQLAYLTHFNILFTPAELSSPGSFYLGEQQGTTTTSRPCTLPTINQPHTPNTDSSHPLPPPPTTYNLRTTNHQLPTERLSSLPPPPTFSIQYFHSIITPIISEYQPFSQLPA